MHLPCLNLDVKVLTLSYYRAEGDGEAEKRPNPADNALGTGKPPTSSKAPILSWKPLATKTSFGHGDLD